MSETYVLLLLRVPFCCGSREAGGGMEGRGGSSQDRSSIEERQRGGPRRYLARDEIAQNMPDLCVGGSPQSGDQHIRAGEPTTFSNRPLECKRGW